MTDQTTSAERTDADLIAAVRSGDRSAFAILWQRHGDAGRNLARVTTRTFDADDLVSEAYLKILAAITAGKGPTGPFRPYLFVTIRNLAVSWARKQRETDLDDANDVPDPRATDTDVLAQLDAGLTLRAFRTLPERWQEVLWFTEVDGLSATQVAERLGLTANTAAVLAFRAREGLRQAWIQAHIDTASASEPHRWALSQIGKNARGALSKRHKARFEAHLADCPACTVIAADAVDTSRRFTSAVVPLAVAVLAATTLPAFLATRDPADPHTPHIDASAATSLRLTHRTRATVITTAAAVVALTGAAIGYTLTPTAEPVNQTATPPTSEPAPTGPSSTTPPTAQPSPQTPAAPDEAAPAAPTTPPGPGTQPQQAPAPSIAQAAPTTPSISPDVGPDTPDSVVTPTITTIDTLSGVVFPIVSGTARPLTTVTVHAGGGQITVQSDSSGHWVTPQIEVPAGAFIVSAQADGRSAPEQDATLSPPTLSASVRAGAVEVTVRGAASTAYGITWDGHDATTVQTTASGNGSAQLMADTTGAHTIGGYARIGQRTGPQIAVTTMQ